MRTAHRITMMFAVIFTLYIGATGSLLQSIDLGVLLTHQPATNPNILSIHQDIDGPPDYVVIGPADYTAQSLPAGLNLAAAMTRLLAFTRATVGSAGLGYVELRQENGRTIGQALSLGRLLRFDAETGNQLPVQQPITGWHPGPRSLHDIVKNIHRMNAYGSWALWLDLAGGIGLFAMIATGLLLYFKLFAGRVRIGRSSLVWSAGGGWRTLHRAVSLVAAAFLLVVAVSGMLLAVDNITVTNFQGHPEFHNRGDKASPLVDANLPAMVQTTQVAFAKAAPGAAAKVIRLRVFGGMPQGVVVAGNGSDTQQLVFNAASGQKAQEHGADYIHSGFAFGWQEHELLKKIHRGDYFGLTGRWVDLLAGLSMIFLSCSGIVLYCDMWQKRQKLGRAGLFWS